MAGISPDRIRAEVRELLPGVDLRSTSVGGAHFAHTWSCLLLHCPSQALDASQCLCLSVFARFCTQGRNFGNGSRDSRAVWLKTYMHHDMYGPSVTALTMTQLFRHLVMKGVSGSLGAPSLKPHLL